MRRAYAAFALLIAACSSSDDGGKPTPTVVPSALPDAAAARPPDAALEAEAEASPGHDAADAMDDAAISSPPPHGPGHITFKHPDGTWRRVAATPGANLENMSAAMSKVSPGSDDFVNISKDGTQIIATGNRFGCANGACLSLFGGDLSSGKALQIGGKAVSTESGRSVVSASGTVIVFPARGTHVIDLFATVKSGATWSAPLLLTGASPFSHHHDTAISSDGTRVVFDCGREPYGAPPTSICEVKTDGSGFRTLVDPTDGPDHGSTHAPHHPDYAPDGSVVFEADWPSEQVWRRPLAGGSPVKLSAADYTDDNSPCVLPDGRVVSLWLGRKANTAGNHEIKVMDPDGANPVMLVIGIDVVDIGMGCAN